MNRNSTRQNINVFTRYRPINDVERFIASEAGDAKTADKMEIDEKSNIILIGNDGHKFSFDRVFGPDTSQKPIFDVVGKSMCDDILSGYNGTIFVYGQTGSGKTYTMYGEEDKPNIEPHAHNSLYPVLGAPAVKHKQNKIETMGLIPRCANYILNHLQNTQDIDTYNVSCAFLEIYQEKPRDLSNKSAKQTLKIKLNQKGEEYIHGLEHNTVYEIRDILELIQTAIKNRATEKTDMNPVSSRSHLLMQMDVSIHLKDGTIRMATANFVDLAGSERVKKTNAKGQILREAKSINKSLSALGLVINQLSSGKQGHISYRDSMLTRVLCNSLGGNCKTSLIVTVSPDRYNREETISSLTFGENCKKIQNKAKINKVFSNQELMKKVKFLQQKNEELQDVIKHKGYGVDQVDISTNNEEEMNGLKEKIWDLENKLNVEMKKRVFYGAQIEEMQIEEALIEKRNTEAQTEETRLQDKNTIKELNERVTTQREREEVLSTKIKWIEQRNEDCNDRINALQSELSTTRPIKSDVERLQVLNAQNIEKERDLENSLRKMEQEKNGYEEELLSIEHIVTQKENEYKMKENKLKSQNERLLNEQKKLKQQVNDKENEGMIILQQQKELLRKEEELQREYEAKLDMLQTTYCNETKGFEESMSIAINRNKEEIERSMKDKQQQREDILRKQVIIEIRKEIEKEFETERNEMYENQFIHQEQLQSELDKAKQHNDHLKQTQTDLRNEIAVLQINHTQKFENIESENQLLRSQNDTLKKQTERQREKYNIKLQEQIETERAKNQYQFNLMQQQHHKTLELLKNELEIERAKNESIHTHIEQEENVLVEKRKDEAQMIDQQLAYLDNLNLAIRINQDEKLRHEDHKQAIQLHEELNPRNDDGFNALGVVEALQAGISITELFPNVEYRNIFNNDDEKQDPDLDGTNHECCICLEEYQQGEQKRALQCMHTFHANCINQWIDGMGKRYCPVCGVNVDGILM